MAVTATATEPARDALQRAADHLERSTPAEFRREFAPIFDMEGAFDPGTDALDIALVPDAQQGISDWEFAHVRVEGNESTCHARTRFTDGIHLEGVSAIHPIGYELGPAKLQQGLFEVLVFLLTRPNPGAALANPTLKVTLYDDDLALPSIVEEE